MEKRSMVGLMPMSMSTPKSKSLMLGLLVQHSLASPSIQAAAPYDHARHCWSRIDSALADYTLVNVRVLLAAVRHSTMPPPRYSEHAPSRVVMSDDDGDDEMPTVRRDMRAPPTRRMRREQDSMSCERSQGRMCHNQ